MRHASRLGLTKFGMFPHALTVPCTKDPAVSARVCRPTHVAHIPMANIGRAMELVAHQQYLDVDYIGRLLAAGHATNTGRLELSRQAILRRTRQDFLDQASEVRGRADLIMAQVDFLERRIAIMEVLLAGHE